MSSSNVSLYSSSSDVAISLVARLPLASCSRNSGMACLSQKLISASRSAADLHSLCMCSKEICHVRMMELLACLSRFGTVPCWRSRLVLDCRLFSSSARYLSIEYFLFCLMNDAACDSARGMKSRDVASFVALPSSYSGPNFFCSSVRACTTSNGMTSITLFSSTNLYASSLLRDVMTTVP